MPQKLIQTNNPDRTLVGSRETNQIKNQCILSRLAWGRSRRYMVEICSTVRLSS